MIINFLDNKIRTQARVTLLPRERGWHEGRFSIKIKVGCSKSQDSDA